MPFDRTWSSPAGTLACVRYAPGVVMHPHVDRAHRVSIVLAGSLDESHAGTVETAHTLSVVSKPGGARHANRIGPDGAVVLSLLDPVLEAPDRPRDRLRTWRWVHGGSVAAQAVGMLAALRVPTPDRADALAEAATLLLDALADIGAPAPSDPPAWLPPVRDRLHDAPDRRVSVATLAADAGVHPTHLTRCFRTHFGATVTRYRIRLRTQTAAHALASSARPIAQVALQSGFSDQSHLTRTFADLYGTTPARFRRWIRDVV